MVCYTEDSLLLEKSLPKGLSFYWRLIVTLCKTSFFIGKQLRRLQLAELEIFLILSTLATDENSKWRPLTSWNLMIVDFSLKWVMGLPCGGNSSCIWCQH